MFDQISLKNFQSHKDSVVHFSSGINAIVGPSNNGKTAIVRGFDWLFHNRPLGLSMVSHWNRDKKGNPKEETSVCISINAFDLVRVRDKEFNGYKIFKNGELISSLEAAGSEVPEEILKILNMSEVNIQRQLDSHFLLSSSSAEVARFFNTIVRQDIIDKTLSAVDSKKRQFNQDIKALKESVKNKEEQLKTYSWTETTESLINKAKKVDSRIQDNLTLKVTLQKLMEKLADSDRVLSRLNNLSSAEGLAEKITDLNGNLTEKRQRVAKLSRLVKTYQEWDEKIKRIPDLDQPINTLKVISSFEETLKYYKKKIKQLTSLMSDYEDALETIKSSSEKIQKYKAQLPKVCPVCGKVMDNEINNCC
jgi:exonuclease SbcC